MDRRELLRLVGAARLRAEGQQLLTRSLRTVCVRTFWQSRMRLPRIGLPGMAIRGVVSSGCNSLPERIA